MRGKVTADAYSGGRRVGGEVRDDDWDVTRHHLLASLQPIRAEQIGCCSKYGIIPFGYTESSLGAMVMRDVSPPSWGRRVGRQCVAACGVVI